MSNDADGENLGELLDPITQTVREAYGDEVLVTGYTVFVTMVLPDGDTGYYGETMPGQSATTTLGHAASVDAIERQRVIDHHFAD